jgi:hypothetical protein
MNVNFLQLDVGWLWFILAAYGLTQILVYSSIFAQIRPDKDSYRGWGKVWHCPMCMGFWVGALLFTLNGFTELFTFDYTFANFLICGWISSGTSYFISMLVNDDGIKINKGAKNDD